MNYPFPYTSEKFTKKEKQILSHFFTNFDKPVFAIFDLPQEVVGAMFSRYSRTGKSIRRVFLDEFWSAEIGFSSREFQKAKQRTSDFYKKVFAEFGDDSVIQMGSVHIAFEFISQIAAKAIEDGRIAAAYIEKSTRYVDFGNKIKNHYLFMEPPEIMQSKYSQEFLNWNKQLFRAYTKYVPLTIEFFRKKYPLPMQEVQNAYERALKAKALDTVRVFLPSATVTNLGAHFSGQAAENALNKLISSPYKEVQILGQMALEELIKISPNFLQHVDHDYGKIKRDYLKKLKTLQSQVASRTLKGIKDPDSEDVRLVDWDKDAALKIASQILYTAQEHKRISKKTIRAKLKKFSNNQLRKLIEKSLPDRKSKGFNRRHKLPRAFEHAFAEVEFNVDFGIYRDLQRNRMCTTERQLLSAKEIFIPEEFKQKGMEKVLKDYLALAQKTQKLQEKLLKYKKYQYAAEYVTMFGNKLRFNIKANMRQWVFFAELRTIEGGHPSYRHAIQKATKQIIEKMPFMKKLFAHVNWQKSKGLGRLKAEIKTQQKLSKAK